MVLPPYHYQRNHIARLYWLAQQFVQLSVMDKFQIGLKMNILLADDAMLPAEDIEDLIFEEVVEEKRYNEFLTQIYSLWSS